MIASAASAHRSENFLHCAVAGAGTAPEVCRNPVRMAALHTAKDSFGSALRPDNPLAQAPYLMPPFSLTNPSGVAALNAEATRQAAMVAYIDDFKPMMIIIIVALPLLLLFRRPRPIPGAVAAALD